MGGSQSLVVPQVELFRILIGGKEIGSSSGSSGSSSSSGGSSGSSSGSSSGGVTAIAASSIVKVPQLFPDYFCTPNAMRRLNRITPASVIVHMMEVTVLAVRPYSLVHGTKLKLHN